MSIPDTLTDPEAQHWLTLGRARWLGPLLLSLTLALPVRASARPKVHAPPRDCVELGGWAAGVADVRDHGMSRQDALAWHRSFDAQDRLPNVLRQEHAELIHAIYDRPQYSPEHWERAITLACQANWGTPKGR